MTYRSHNQRKTKAKQILHYLVGEKIVYQEQEHIIKEIKYDVYHYFQDITDRNLKIQIMFDNNETSYWTYYCFTGCYLRIFNPETDEILLDFNQIMNIIKRKKGT